MEQANPYIPEHFKLSLDPVAAPEAMVIVPQARFTVLTPRMIRMEYTPSEKFEDRASQTFWFRKQPVPKFEVKRTDDTVEIITKYLHLQYTIQDQGFTQETLSVTLRESGVTWHYDDPAPQNLGGTYRTLDGANGPVALEPGLMSRDGWAVVDDSESLVFNDESWLEPRATAENAQTEMDIYFFGYGHDYEGCLREYSTVSGSFPMIPRWILGNWWSRYWAYTQDELQGLMQSFKEHEVPFSVCIVDMDWHITDTGTKSSGWTGYTWNRDLFPNPEGFMTWLHKQGLKTALNLHPASGVYPHEAAYPEMAEALGVEDEDQPVAFDIAEPKFAKAYFEILHHPMEAQGVDFWWIDWQQGTQSKIKGLDPLWWLNHLHFYDIGRDGDKRRFIFSRWGGLGNHRYPIGFSGDTVVSWDSLAFQPYFTATAANVGYGWWSHDIGGHMGGVDDSELYTRWIQFGVFSPVMRIHSTKTPYLERRPWKHDIGAFHIIRDALQLRHALIPYLYTMAWRNAQEHLPPVAPMYHKHPEEESAYWCPDQYYFGSELVVAPFTKPRDPDTRLSRQVVWLPEGTWFHFLNGNEYTGDRWHSLYGDLDEIPVFARAGAIVPLGPQVGWGGIQNPDTLIVHIFPGADNEFTLYEDDGETAAYRSGAYALTHLAQTWQTNSQHFSIGAIEGDSQQIPEQRTYTLVFHNVIQPEKVDVYVNETILSPEWQYDAETATVTLPDIKVAPNAALRVNLSTSAPTLQIAHDQTLATCHRLLHAFKLNTHIKSLLHTHLPELNEDITKLAALSTGLTDSQLQALIETLVGVGVAYVYNPGYMDTLFTRLKGLVRETLTEHIPTLHKEATRFGVDVPLPFMHRVVEMIAEGSTKTLEPDGPQGAYVLWNNAAHPGMNYVLAGSSGRRWHPVVKTEAENVPTFKALTPTKTFEGGRWKLRVNYFDLLTLEFTNEA